MKKFNSAPLPFQGQKRNFAKHLRTVLRTLPKDITIVDLFGGSGLLARIAKDELPNATVIYNDYDNYRQRLFHVSDTNALLAEIRILLKDVPRKNRIPDNIREQIIAIINRYISEGKFIDYITLSASILFSMRYANNMEELCADPFYHRVRKDDYNTDGYLDGLIIHNEDYRSLIRRYSSENCVFLADPPYLNTSVDTYCMSWDFGDYLDVLKHLKGKRFIYFTSDKTNILKLSDWIGRNSDIGNIFQDSTIYKVKASMNYSSCYTDIMCLNIN